MGFPSVSTIPPVGVDLSDVRAFQMPGMPAPAYVAGGVPPFAPKSMLMLVCAGARVATSRIRINAVRIVPLS